MAGVYVIKGTIPGWFGGEYAYVGLSRNIAKRLEWHRAEATAGSHTNGTFVYPKEDNSFIQRDLDLQTRLEPWRQLRMHTR